MTEVLESELQCSVCSELFIEVKKKRSDEGMTGKEHRLIERSKLSLL